VKTRHNPLVNVALLIATLITTAWAGAAYQGINLWRNPEMWTTGLPYALGVLLILGVHEMGHFLAARYHGVRVSLPYFIPMPFSLGTLGAFVRIEEDPRERHKVFDIAAAGPLAGLAASLGILVAGLYGTSVPSTLPSVGPGSSLLLGLLARTVGSHAYGHSGHPLVFAGSLGLMITAFNLLPVAQLDGGHMARALLGERAALWIGRITLGVMLLLGAFVWHGFLLWALIAFAFGERPSTDDGSEDVARLEGGLSLDLRRRAIGLVSFALVALILIPMPGSTPALSASGCPWL
jgi:membrane-associated protease RseP (regulator of RpoE activity)